MPGSFILSCARSGSTLTRFIVDTHPDIYSPAELKLGELASTLYFCIASLEGRIGYALPENAGIVTRVGEILRNLLDAKTGEKGKRIWCEKTPDNLSYLDFLTLAFPDAGFVCLHRHALDVAHSCLETSRFGFLPVLEKYVHHTPRNTLQAVIQYWVDGTSTLLDFERTRSEATFRVRYEDIVLSPEAVLEPLFRFLRVDWDPSILQSVFTSRHEAGVGDRYVRFSGRIHADSLGRGRNLPIETLPDDLKHRMSSLLAELGYGADPVGPELTSPLDHPQNAPRPSDLRETSSWVFDSLVAERLRAGGESLPPLSCTIAVQGVGGGTWSVEIGGSGCRVVPGGEASCRIEILADDLLDIVHGRANAVKIAQEGRIRVQGQLSDESLSKLIQLIRTDLGPAPGA
jgi:protein-tyrosine sulfotransferase